MKTTKTKEKKERQNMNRENLDTVRKLQFKPQERNSILNIIELIDKIGRDRKIHLLFCVMQN